MNATTPLFTVIVAGIVLTDERTTPMKLIGVAIGFVGVILMLGPSALRGLGVDVFAQIGVLGAAMSYAFAGVFGRRFKSIYGYKSCDHRGWSGDNFFNNPGSSRGLH